MELQSEILDAPRVAGAQDAEYNRLLRALPAEEYAQMLPHLETVNVPVKAVLFEPGESIEYVYFPRTCVMSLITPLDNDVPVEAATIGCEGLVGLPVFLGGESTTVRGLNQIPGQAVRMRADAFRSHAADAGGTLAPLVLRYTQSLLEQTAQSVACNRRHSIEQRCARWLAMTRERVRGDQFPLTQELLAQMLGVRRASVSEAMALLQERGLVRYTRGKVTVVDRHGLEQASCVCYHVVRARYDQLVSGPCGARES